MHPWQAKGLSVKLLTVIACPASLVIAAAVWLAGGRLELMCVDKRRQQRQKVDSHRADSQHTPSAFLPAVIQRNQKPILIALLNRLNGCVLSLGWKKQSPGCCQHVSITSEATGPSTLGIKAIKNNLYNYFSLAGGLWDQRWWNTVMYFAMNK